MPRPAAPSSVLIVDDDPHIAANMQEMFAEFGGYVADVALNPFDGLAKLKNKRYDMVFTDLIMPGMNGIELLQSIKMADSSMEVVMVTGFPTVALAVQAMQEGAADFITKPFRAGQLKIVAERLSHERALLHEHAALQDELKNKKIIEMLTMRLSSTSREISTLYSVSELFAAPHLGDDLSTVYAHIADVALEITGCSFSLLMLIDNHNRQLLPAAAAGVSDSGIRASIAMDDLPVVQKLLRAADPPFPGPPAPICAQALGIGGSGEVSPSCLILPLRIKDEPFAMLIVGDRDAPARLSGSQCMLLKNLLHKACLTIENRLLYDSIFDTMRDTLHSLVSAIEARDKYTLTHSLRVTDYSMRIAAMIGCTQDEMDILRSAGHLHDIGKIGISDAILLKRGDLSLSETAIIHDHPVIGEHILRPLGFLPLERDIIRYHHERWDGTGYPDGLRGDAIPLLSRIIAVSDSFDAMTTDRPYRQALKKEAALNELRACRRQFDPRVIEAFFECMRV